MLRSKRPAVALATLLFLLWKYIQRRQFLADVERITGGVPGSMGLPGIGETIDFSVNVRNFIADRARLYGPVFKTNVVGANVICVSTPELAEHAYNSKDFKAGSFSTFAELMEGFLLLQNGKDHERPKRLLAYALTDTALRNNLSFLTAELMNAVYNWRGRVISISTELKAMLIQLMSKVLICDLSESEIEEIAKAMTIFGKGFFALPINSSFLTYGQALIARAKIIKFLEGHARKRRQNPAKYAGFTDVLQSFINYIDPDTGKGHTETFIAQNTLVAIFGSLDTTASLMTSCVLKANEYPQCLDRLTKEFCGVFGESHLFSPSSVTLEQLNSLQYMHAFICEVSRMMSPFAAAFRTAETDARLPGTPYTVPKGWLIAISQDATFRTAGKEFPSPTEFNPDKFLPGAIASMHGDFKHSLFPFGKGAHLCPGRSFALAETKLLLCIFLNQSRTSSVHKQEFPRVLSIPAKFVDKPSIEPEGDALVKV